EGLTYSIGDLRACQILVPVVDAHGLHHECVTGGCLAEFVVDGSLEAHRVNLGKRYLWWCVDCIAIVLNGLSIVFAHCERSGNFHVFYGRYRTSAVEIRNH